MTKKPYDAPLAHGGDIRKGKRKLARPLIVKCPVHVVLRSSIARGNWSLLSPRNVKRVNFCVRESARRFDVKIHKYVNVGNHLHLLVKAQRKKDFQHFLRYLSGRIALIVTGARKGRSVLKIAGTTENRREFFAGISIPGGVRFWDRLAFTRVVGLGADFDKVLNYLELNLLESFGLIDRKNYKRTPKIFGDIRRELRNTS